MKFFMLQPLAITLEHIVAAFSQGAGIHLPSSISRAVGYLWVLCWFTVTSPFWIEPVVREGLLEDGYHFPLVFPIGKALRRHLGVF